jgi:hypothetical protein
MGLAFFCLCHDTSFHAPFKGLVAVPDELHIHTHPKVSHEDLLKVPNKMSLTLKLRSIIHHDTRVLPELHQIF